MPKPKPPNDPNQAARSILSQVTGEEPRIQPAQKNEAAVELGRRGGLKGGKARADRLSAQQKSEIGRKAAQKRWENK